MADCNETLREMESFLDGELTDDASASLHAHLDGCGTACRRSTSRPS